MRLKKKSLRKRVKSAAQKLLAQRRVALFSWRWREAFVAFGWIALGSLIPSPGHTLAITGVSFPYKNITYEQGGLPNGVTVQFTIDSPGTVQISVNQARNFGTTGPQVALFSQSFPASAVGVQQTMFWNGLWFFDGAPGRINGTYQFTLTLSTTVGTTSVSTSVTPPDIITLNSVDIHSVSVAPSVDADGQPTFPYRIRYALAKQANVTVAIVNSTGTVIRTVVPNQLQVDETVSTHTVSWDGFQTNNQPAPLGVYTVLITATDPAVQNSAAIPSSSTITIGSLTGAGVDAKKTFEDNAYVFPNPVRNGQGIFHYEAARTGGTVTLRIYTITGTLVLDKDFGAPPVGVPQRFTWDATNQSGNKVGRGLYFYVLRESDPEGVLQVTKKLAVIK